MKHPSFPGCRFSVPATVSPSSIHPALDRRVRVAREKRRSGIGTPRQHQVHRLSGATCPVPPGQAYHAAPIASAARSLFAATLMLPVGVLAIVASDQPLLTGAGCTALVAAAMVYRRMAQRFSAKTSYREPEQDRPASEDIPSGSSTRQGGPAPDERLLMTAGVTHELRTPLTILKGRLHGIEDGVISADEHETARLLRQVEHVLEIVNDLDTLAQADMGRLSLNPRKVDLMQLTSAVISDLRPLLARHDMTIVETCAEPVLLEADPVRITQIVTNLVSNASKHSSTGGRIFVDVAQRNGEACLTVTDEGPGFSPADSERLFIPFWRSAETIRRPGCPGTGMGLALTARLVAAHGGSICAENREDRSGARFRVTFPVGRPVEYRA